MTAAFTYLMNQTATYWPPVVTDGFGGVSFGAPVAIKCRWSDKRDLIKNSEGQEVASSAAVHVDRVLAEKGYLKLGDVTSEVDSDGLSDPKDYEGAHEIISVSQVPSLDASEELHKVWL